MSGIQKVSFTYERADLALDHCDNPGYRQHEDMAVVHRLSKPEPHKMAPCDPQSFPLSQDILYQILDNPDILRKGHLASAALVSRIWTAPAQSALYKEVACTYESQISLDSLYDTMNEYPHLRPLLRSLCTPIYSNNEKVQQFMRLLPPHFLRQLHLDFQFHIDYPRVYLPLSFWQIPAVQTLSSLTVWYGIHNVQELATILVPTLVHLELVFPGVETYAFDGHYNYPIPPNLRHFTVEFSYTWIRPMYDLFIALSPQLESFTTDGPWYVNGDFHQWRDAAIARYGRGLKKLLLLGQESERGRPWSPSPFLDELIKHTTRLEHLHVVECTYTGFLFKNLPPSLQVLEFTPDNHAIPFEEDLLDCLLHVKERKLSLSRICLHNDECYGNGPRGEEEFARIADACAASGIEYIYDPYESW
ncbi:hypothetical protein OH76DRAFT_1487239 [Lentinus brumalis]|uniref:F-box domain-containing protein n=1 Tax=Lentinus brumalis TaxID=2498619 RepID=A0A371CVI0_9APHY|nr:hypothetical protein OH76DRAFT_1487239 [Polyporus brumalis]